MNEQRRALNENVSLGARVCDPQSVGLRPWLRLTEPRSSRVKFRHRFSLAFPPEHIQRLSTKEKSWNI